MGYKSPHFQEFGTGAQRCHQAFRQATSTETASSKDTRGRESRRLHGADTQADQWESPSCTQEVHQCYRYEDSTLKILQNQIISITVWCSMLKTLNMCFLLDMLTPDELKTIERLTGCSAQIRPPSCRTTPLINKYRTITSICNNRSVFPSFGVFFQRLCVCWVKHLTLQFPGGTLSLVHPTLLLPAGYLLNMKMVSPSPKGGIPTNCTMVQHCPWYD